MQGALAEVSSSANKNCCSPWPAESRALGAGGVAGAQHVSWAGFGRGGPGLRIYSSASNVVCFQYYPPQTEQIQNRLSAMPPALSAATLPTTKTSVHIRQQCNAAVAVVGG